MSQSDAQYLTKEKFTELTNELDFLKTTRRKEVAENLEYSKKLGDLSENAEYHEAREEQAKVEDRIMHIESILKSAKVLEERKADTIGVGSTVVVEKDGKDGSAEHKFKIVGSEEADMMQGKLSHMSPLGGAILGKRKGDVIEIMAPKGKTKYTIKDVE